MHAVEKAEIIRSLRQAKELLNSYGWNQGVYAMNEDGESDDYASPEAVSFCMAGALHRACIDIYGNDETETFDRSILALARILQDEPGRPVISDWNDAPGRTKEEAIALLDRTIAWLEKGP